MQMGQIKYKIVEANGKWQVRNFKSNLLQSEHKSKEDAEEAAQSYVAQDYLEY